MALEKEQTTYQRELPNLLVNEGKFVLIHGDVVAGVFDTYHDALQIGYQQIKLEPFFIKQISAAEKVQFFSRSFTTARTRTSRLHFDH
jgi:hypothetical protein